MRAKLMASLQAKNGAKGMDDIGGDDVLVLDYNDVVKEGDKIFTVYAMSERKIDEVIKVINTKNPIVLR